MWQTSGIARIAFGLLGLVVLIVGLGVWSFETEYGGNSVGGSETSDGITRVFDVDEGSIGPDGNPVTTIVFEGSESEARVFMDQRRGEGRNYTVPILILLLGVVLVALAIAPSFRGSRGSGGARSVDGSGD